MKVLEDLGIRIKSKKILYTALTHSSYAYEEEVEDYERLEFLGDSVLQIIISEYLYLNTKLSEGDMSKTRASFVCEAALARYSKDIGLVKYINVGHGHTNNINDTIIADVFESVLGAIYLSNGMKDAKKLVESVVIPYIKKNHPFMMDYKSTLQEMVQTDKTSVEYKIIKEKGPAHKKEYVAEVYVDGIVFGRGSGKSKKDAEQAAAKDAYEKSAR